MAILLPAGLAGTGGSVGGPEAVRKALGTSASRADTIPERSEERRDSSPADDRTVSRCGITWRRWAGWLIGCTDDARRP
ncbi:hypothetical protein [Actinomadura sp. SCN-SB]|uniref:hypothetical protein n=1 Tax=Actinomadura sp. SCN-SB TaxID=3373092 RepID=UPI0037512D4F